MSINQDYQIASYLQILNISQLPKSNLTLLKAKIFF